jgi:hypothetical protein
VDGVYSIKNWEKHFELSQAKRVKGPLSWVPIPTKQDGLAFRSIMALEDGLAIFGAWILMLEIAAKCKQRGQLGESADDGVTIPYGPEQLATMTGAPAETFERAFKVLSSPEVAWILRAHSENAQSTLGAHSKHAGITVDLEKRREDKRRRDKKRREKSSSSTVCDDAFLSELQAAPAYEKLNVKHVYNKLVVFCKQEGEQATRDRLIAWLNREYHPLSGNGATEYDYIDQVKKGKYAGPAADDSKIHR